MEIEVLEEYRQLSLITPTRIFYVLGAKEQQKIRSSFDGFFRREILPLIPLNLARRLYSGKSSGRPPAFLIEEIAARIYIRCQGLDETYFLSHVHTDAAIQYALGTENLAKQPFSRNTFKRQRERIREYNKEFDADIWNDMIPGSKGVVL